MSFILMKTKAEYHLDLFSPVAPLGLVVERVVVPLVPSAAAARVAGPAHAGVAGAAPHAVGRLEHLEFLLPVAGRGGGTRAVACPVVIVASEII